MKSEFKDKFLKNNDLLIERGFAKAVRNRAGEIESLHLTDDGEVILKSLRRLFDIPNVKPADLMDSQIAELIMVILLHKPRDKN